jgi:hypothetical protein
LGVTIGVRGVALRDDSFSEPRARRG